MSDFMNRSLFALRPLLKGLCFFSKVFLFGAYAVIFRKHTHFSEKSWSHEPMGPLAQGPF